MKKAETIEDIYDVFAPEKYLTKEDKEFYVDLYGEKLKRFVTALQFNKVPSKTFFIAGQSGNGKSTVLNLLTTNFEEIEEKYIFHTIAGRTIFSYNDIDIIDILLMIGNIFIKDSKILKEKYFEKLNQLTAIEDTPIKNTSIGKTFLNILKAGIDFGAFYRLNEGIRIDARVFFKTRKTELINLINEIILEYKIEQNNDKDLILIIDNLEKKDNIDRFFLEEISLLNELNIVKIITIPIHLYRNETFPQADVREFGLKLNTFDGDEYIHDKKLLKKVIDKRLADKNLISKNAINMAVDFSGANLRQLIQLIHISAEKSLSVDGSQITPIEIEDAIKTLQLAYSSKVNSMKTFLTQIEETKAYEDNSENLVNIDKATKLGLVFAYFNGIEWYELNPIIKETLKKYNDLEYIEPKREYYNSTLPIKNNYINSIKIDNYFSIKHIELENLKDKKEIYFVGENGDGKTILLQALALAYKDVDNYPILADKYLRTLKKPFLFDIEDKFINDNLFAYGINRNKTNADDVDSSGYASLFDTPNINDTTSFNRPQDLFILDNAIVKEFIKGVEYLLENKIKITQRGNETIFSETSNESIDIEFKMLSEGYKSTIIWLSDLLFRLIKNQPYISKLEEFKAVVLIDEIDLYLHPKWKYQFVHRLREMFPKIQFVMTTHSITTILGARDDAVFYQVYKDEDGLTQLSGQIDDISDYSANILITSPMFNMQSAKSRSYDDSKNSLSDDDYREHQLNKDIDKMLRSDESKKIKLDILAQLKEL